MDGDGLSSQFQYMAIVKLNKKNYQMGIIFGRMRWQILLITILNGFISNLVILLAELLY